ncbi:hypothetical protein [Neisseria sp. Ec49-e6-T10]|uniref:hypothetical protein n=1 Tax=Neisseria sp. Ec49-e6-T10 TaxID=3140744 RepID=UPI003EBA719F
MSTRHLGIMLISIGAVLCLCLLVLYFWRPQPENVSYQQLIKSITQNDAQPQLIHLPSLEYHQALNSGLWGFERILRKNNKITEGKYQQLCQDGGKILKQLNFWLNAPYHFKKKYPTETLVMIRPSVVTHDKITHHFALDKISSSKSGLSLKRHEVKIEWAQEQNLYSLTIQQSERIFSAYNPSKPNVWLNKLRHDLYQHPLTEQFIENEQKMIAFRLGDCT